MPVATGKHQLNTERGCKIQQVLPKPDSVMIYPRLIKSLDRQGFD